MKNPYRSLEYRPLRTLLVCTLLVLAFIKLIPVMFLMFDDTLNPVDIHRLTLLAVALATTCLLDMGTLHSLTVGFGGLLDRPWFVLLSPAINLLATAGLVSFFTITPFMVASGELPWWTGPLRVSLVSLLLLMQAGGAVVLFARLRSDRPLPL